MMTIRQKLEKLALEKNSPCVSISFNTHRTHPENAQDKVVLKNLLKEAEDRVIEEYGKRSAADLLIKIASVSDKIDMNYNLDSLHIFLSDETQEIIKSVWPVSENTVQISETFAIRPLIKASNRSEEYLILVLSQGGVQLYEALNDNITSEFKNEDFPFPQIKDYSTEKNSEPKHVDNTIREFFNKVDKAVVKVHNESGRHCVTICTEDNYSHLMKVADYPAIYLGYAAIDYNNVATHQIAKQSWDLIRDLQAERRTEAISEMQGAVSQGKVLTDLQEIYQASIDGRGDLLIVHQDFAQPVLMTSDRTFDLSDDPDGPDVIDDITSNLAWEVLSKKGRVIFTSQEQLEDLGDIVLKTRY